MKDDFNPEPGQTNPSNASPESLQEALDSLLETRRSGQATPAGVASSPCPDLGDLALVLHPHPAPQDSTRVDALLAHASACGFCAEKLRLLSADSSPEEQSFVAGLSLAASASQRTLAARLARTPTQSAFAANRSYLWLVSGLAASLLIAIGLVSWWRIASNPERLMAQAYTQSRIFDLRVPGAGFAPVSPSMHLRGSSSGRESSRLLEARARIEQHLDLTPQDPHWLQLEARADILDENYDAAIDILDRLVAAGPATSGLLLDDASAYFQRGVATGSENDRTTALEDLRRADELAPDDPVILFNEAVVMEDRGQLMNAVETWNRYIRFERDPKWLAEGKTRLQALEQKLDQLKTHQARIDKRLASPQAMLDLAANPSALAAVGEELSSSLLPRLLEKSFPLPQQSSPADRSRGSPCIAGCPAARTLLYALAASLQQNHQDSWLTSLLPSDPSHTDPSFPPAASALAKSIDSQVHGDYPAAASQAALAAQMFHRLPNPSGEDRASVQQADALQAVGNYAGCYHIVHPLQAVDPSFVWTQSLVQALDAYCDPSTGADVENNPSFVSSESLAQVHHYALIELRVRNMRAGAAVDAGDVESAWRDYLAAIRQFYAGDYPAIRLSGTVSSLAQVEQSTPRTRVALLLQREHVSALELSGNSRLLPTARLSLAAVAVRAGSIEEAQQSIRTAQAELAANGGGRSVFPMLAEVETALANAYLDRGQTAQAGKMLDSAFVHMAGEQNSIRLRIYSVARAQLDLELGTPAAAEPLLRDAILEQERLGRSGGPTTIILAQQNRNLYSTLAAVWLAQSRPPASILALWERYRLRALGVPIPACPGKALDCLQPRLDAALRRSGFARLVGQIVLPDRVLLYSATHAEVTFLQLPTRQNDILAAVDSLARDADSPQTPIPDVDRAARRVGQLLLDPIGPIAPSGGLLIESDPLLGNLPWPSVQTAADGLGLVDSLEESPSVLLNSGASPARPSADEQALIVGASVASGEQQLLPEVLEEARTVAHFDVDPTLLIGNQATQPQVLAHLANAVAIHFAGHADVQQGETRLLLAPDPPTRQKSTAQSSGNPNPSQDSPWIDSAILRHHPPRLARLAVFSACSSGKSQPEWNHGMGDLVATLAALGVPDVVATRWQIDSGAAVPMMDAFYANLARGLTVPQALTAARQSLIRNPRYRHPYYWAAWYASGSGTANLSPIFRTAGN